MKKAEARYWKKQFDEAESPQEFWKIVNKTRKKESQLQSRSTETRKGTH